MSPEARPAAGLLLLTGGAGRRLGGPKHLRDHPQGGSWGGHLVALFQDAFPDGPVELLGEPLPDLPQWPARSDPRQGPAVALSHWARGAAGRFQPGPDHWWVAACDQLRWTAPVLRAWHAQALAADPEAGRWVLARHQGRIQFLGGWLASSLLVPLGALAAPSLHGLAEALPTALLESPGREWEDLDTPEAVRAWLAPPSPG